MSPPPQIPRERLADAVAKLAIAIARGDCTPNVVELRALAMICLQHGLEAEAWRIQRWIGQL